MTEQEKAPTQSVVFLGMAQPSEEVFGVLSTICGGRPITFLTRDVEPREALRLAIPLVDRKPNGEGVFIIPIAGTNEKTLKVFQGLTKIGASVQDIHEDPEGIIEDHDQDGVSSWMETGVFPQIDPYADLLNGLEDEEEADPYANLLEEDDSAQSDVPAAPPGVLPEDEPALPMPSELRAATPKPLEGAPPVSGFDFGGGSLALDAQDPEETAQFDAGDTYQPDSASTPASHQEPYVAPEQRPSSFSPPTPRISGDTSVPLPSEPQVRQPRPLDDFQEHYPKGEALTSESGEGDSPENTDLNSGGARLIAPDEDRSAYMEPKLLTQEDADKIPHLAEADPYMRDRMTEQINQRRRYGNPEYVRRTARSASGKCVAVTGVKGGVGKTTTTWMLANTVGLSYSSLVNKGRLDPERAPKVFLIEADLSNPQLFNRIMYNSKGLSVGSHSSTGLQALASKIDEHTRKNGSLDAEFLYDAVVGCSVKISRSNLYVIPAPPSGARGKPISREKLQAFCVMAVDSLMQNGDVVFVDCDRTTKTDFDPLIGSICRDRATHVVMTMIPNTKNLLSDACDILTQSQVDGYGNKNSNVLDKAALHVLVNEAPENSIASVRESVPSYKAQVKVRIPLYPDLKNGDPDASSSSVDTWAGNMRSGQQRMDMTVRYGVFAAGQLGFHEFASMFGQNSKMSESRRDEKARAQNKPTLGGKIRGMLNRT